MYQRDPTEVVFRVATGYMASITLNVAVELGIADLLDDGPLPVSELAQKCEADDDALYRSLRLLASVGVFVEPSARSFANNPPSEALRSGGEGSVRDITRWLCDPLHYRAYAELMYSVKTGKPCFDRVFGKPIFEYLPGDPRELEIFNNGMTSFSAAVIPAALEAFDFGDIGTLIDVAGGHGEVLCSILQKYPSMRGVLTDQEHVLQGAAANLARHGVEDRRSGRQRGHDHKVASDRFRTGADQ